MKGNLEGTLFRHFKELDIFQARFSQKEEKLLKVLYIILQMAEIVFMNVCNIYIVYQVHACDTVN
jgi:hypothetical protein